MNPYIPLGDYTPDGEPHVFGDRVYLRYRGKGTFDLKGFCFE